MKTLTSVTVLTLVMVPTMYSITEDITNLMNRFRGGKATPAMVAATLALFAISPTAHAVTLEEALRAAEDHSLDLRIVEESWESCSPYNL